MVINKVAENVFGAIGMICWAVEPIPQIWKSYRSKSTDGLSMWLVLTWGMSGTLRSIYLIVQNVNIPLILQPQIVSLLFAISWAQCLLYGHKWPLKRCVLGCAALIALSAGFEVAMIYVAKHLAMKGNTIPLKFFSITSSVITALGLLPQYWEIYKRKEVIGLSLAFMAVDIGGGVFSILSLVFKKKFDVLASLVFIIIVVMVTVIMIAALVLNPIARRKRAAQTSVEEVLTGSVLTSGIGGSDSPDKSDLEMGDKLPLGGNLAEAYSTC